LYGDWLKWSETDMYSCNTTKNIILHEKHKHFKTVKHKILEQATINKYSYIECVVPANSKCLNALTRGNVYVHPKFSESITNYHDSSLWLYSMLYYNDPTTPYHEDYKDHILFHGMLKYIYSDIFINYKLIVEGKEVNISNKPCIKCSQAISCLTEGVKHLLYPGCKYDLLSTGVLSTTLIYK